MPIPIADEDIHQPGGQKRTGIHAILRRFLETLEESFRTDYPLVLCEWTGALALGGPLFDGSEHARELLAELPQDWIIRHHGHRRCDVQDTGSLEERS